MEQSDMCLALNMAKMAKRGFLQTTIGEMQFLITKPCAEVQEQKNRGVVFPGHKSVKAAMERHLAMLRQNHSARCLSCQNGTAKNQQTQWRYKEAGAPPPDRCRQPTPELMPPLPKTPPTPTGNNSRAQHSQIVNLPARYAYSHTSLPCADLFTVDASAKDSQHDTDYDPDMLTDKGTSTG